MTGRDSGSKHPSTAGQLIRLITDVTECPWCQRPNVVLRAAGDIARVLMRRTLAGDRHICHVRRSA